MTIKIFGCSFLAGTDLTSTDHVWPVKIARTLDVPVDNHAYPGIGNLRILEAILKESRSDCMNVIGWTWIDRFDFCPATSEQWNTLRPSLDHDMAPYYFRHLHGQYCDMLSNLIYIQTAIDFMHRNHIPFWMTSMDRLLLESVDPSWHDPRGVEALQSYVGPYLSWFNDCTFLQWSRSNDFAISDSLHPLDVAHDAAADLLLPDIQSIYAILHTARNRGPHKYP